MHGADVFGFLVCWVLLFAGVLLYEGSKCVHGPSVWGLSVCKVLVCVGGDDLLCERGPREWES